MSDKPGITTLEQLAEVRKTIAETKRIYAIMYSERLEVKAAVYAGELIKQGAIGKVIQTINIAPHQVIQKAGDAGGGSAAGPTGSGIPSSTAASSATSARTRSTSSSSTPARSRPKWPSRRSPTCAIRTIPQFQDFGDMVLRGDRGLGYVRLDWFTPDGLGTWGDGRLFILGTDGYIEVRKYTDVAVKKQGNNLFIVDQKQARYIDCNNMPLPFGPQFVADIVNRTHIAQDQDAVPARRGTRDQGTEEREARHPEGLAEGRAPMKKTTRSQRRPAASF